MDEEAAMRYWNKYPFFCLYNKFMSQWAWQSRFINECPTSEEIFLRRLFETEDSLAPSLGFPKLIGDITFGRKEIL